jgi:phosphonate transport system substrate-binding protein
MNKISKLSLFLLTTFTLVFASSSIPLAADKTDPDVLRVALLPDENASTIIKNNKSLKEYLEKRIGKKVELVVTTDYSSMIEAMRFGRLELAYFGALSYTLARSRAEIEAFATLEKKGALTYSAVVITHKDSGVNSLKDIRGKTMVYGDIASTSSHLIPRAMLLEEGLTIKKDYEAHYLGAHDAVAVAVQNRQAEVGGLSQPIFKTLVERGMISLDKVKVLQVSPPYPNYPWSMQSYLKPELKDEIRRAFLELKDPSIMKNFKADGFGAVSDADYDVVRKTAKLLGLMK